MRKFLLFTIVIVAGLIAADIELKAQSYSSPGAGMRYNGPPYERSDEMMGENRSAAGTMMGSGRDERRPRNRGVRSCWKETDSTRGFGYYTPCGN